MAKQAGEGVCRFWMCSNFVVDPLQIHHFCKEDLGIPKFCNASGTSLRGTLVVERLQENMSTSLASALMLGRIGRPSAPSWG